MSKYKYLKISCLAVCSLTCLLAVSNGSEDIQDELSSPNLKPYKMERFRGFCVDQKSWCHRANDYKCKKYLKVRRFCPKSCRICTSTSIPPPSTTHLSTTMKTSTGKLTTMQIHQTTPSKGYTMTEMTIMTTPVTKKLITTQMFKTTQIKEKTTKFVPTKNTNSSITKTIAETWTEEPTNVIRSTFMKNATSISKAPEGIPTANARASKSGPSVAIVTATVVSVIFVISLVIFLFVCKRKTNRNLSLSLNSPSIITMQPFNYTRDQPCDSSRSTEKIDCRELYDNCNTYKETDDQSSHNDQRIKNGVQENEPFYHMLEETKPSSKKYHYHSEPLYACAASNDLENEAFELNEPTYDYSQPEGIVNESGTSKGMRISVNQKLLLNKVMKDAKTCKEASAAAMEVHYYHVLEKHLSEHMDNRELPGYQQLIGVTQDVSDSRRIELTGYQPLTGRVQGVLGNGQERS